MRIGPAWAVLCANCKERKSWSVLLNVPPKKTCNGTLGHNFVAVNLYPYETGGLTRMFAHLGKMKRYLRFFPTATTGALRLWHSKDIKTPVR